MTKLSKKSPDAVILTLDAADALARLENEMQAVSAAIASNQLPDTSKMFEALGAFKYHLEVKS